LTLRDPSQIAYLGNAIEDLMSITRARSIEIFQAEEEGIEVEV
jgi:hypothetical protein